MALVAVPVYPDKNDNAKVYDHLDSKKIVRSQD